ncbi:MAG: hypothetical protein JO128_11155 [Alphaproteobacteria bacterium]|nr:hypothetical protein [Alphaproteobacteria bacterium]
MAKTLVRLLFVALAVAGLLAPWPARADRASEDAWLAEIRTIWAHAGNTTAGWAAVEPKALALSGGRVERRGPVLIIKFANGRARKYQNKEGCNESALVERCHIFQLEAYLPTRRAFVIAESFYEGGLYRLVDDRTGRETILDSRPHFGPDPNWFLVIDDDETYGSGRELQIWHRKNDGAVRIWMREAGTEPSPHHIQIVQWQRPDEIVLQMQTEESLNHPVQRWPAILRHEPKGWRLDMTPPPPN